MLSNQRQAELKKAVRLGPVEFASGFVMVAEHPDLKRLYPGVMPPQLRFVMVPLKQLGS